MDCAADQLGVDLYLVQDNVDGVRKKPEHELCLANAGSQLRIKYQNGPER